jgi:Stigma-specific protein, Stig1
MLRLLLWRSLGIAAAIMLGVSLLWVTGLTARLNLTSPGAFATVAAAWPPPPPPAVCNATGLADCIQAAEDDAASCSADCADVPLHARAACLAGCRNFLNREKARCNSEFGVCRAGTGCCNGQCMSLGTLQNCGACGNACSDAQICQGGSCVCPAGLTNCNGTCVDLTSDPAHCGACGTACQVSQFCQSSACVPFIPPDAQAACTTATPTLSASANFNSWFQSGTPSLNGVVNPADSLHFPDVPNCTFYQWSKQMFLWLTSPATSLYGGGRHIFDSPTFYDVLPLDSSGQRSLVQHSPGIIKFFAVRATKRGPDELPIIMDKKHRMFEVQPPKLGPGGNPIILDGSDKEVETGKIAVQNQKVIFFDKTGKPIPNARLLPVRPHPLFRPVPGIRKVPLVQKFIINGRPIFVDPFGNVIDTEEGQAGTGDVLMAQNKSLVYYAMMVNDVYAYFLTGAKNGGIAPMPTRFPILQSDLDKITTFASAHNVSFPDPNALAVEVKTAWVDAASLPNPGDYITMPATVPNYIPDVSNPQDKWVPSGQKDVTLALVSMHVVGSTGSMNPQNQNHGHPEMIWATFEHFRDTPNAPYSYNSTTGQKQICPTSGGTWLFSSSGMPAGAPPCCGAQGMPPCPNSPNQAHMAVDSSGNIVANDPPFHISPSDTRREFPWGIDGGNAGSNTEVISINNSVSSQMPIGDVRNNYFMVGATWTIFGTTPPSSQVGTNLMSNSALETYAQGSNCFGCHVGNMLGNSDGTGLSHIFGPIKPLF